MPFQNNTQRALLFFILAFTSCYAAKPFCSSRCSETIDACYGAEPNECYACEETLFHINSNNGSCELLPQNNLLFSELSNTGMVLTGYTSSQLTPLTCSFYTFSGTYLKGDYIEKTFSNIPLNHYQIVVRFSAGFMGTWDFHDQIDVSLDGDVYSKNYGKCDYKQPICFTAGDDCIKIVSFLVSHSSNSLTLRISSSISETDPAYQFWGVKDLNIFAKMCSPKCDTCFGPSSGECITCANGYFLWGNLCVKECDDLYYPEKRMCVQECPVGTFENIDKECISCEADCLVCSNVIGCEVWSNKKSGVIWEQNKMFWILLIVIGFVIMLYLFWQCVIRRKFKSLIPDGDIVKRMVTDNGLEETKEKSNKSQGSSDSKEDTPPEKDEVVIFDNQEYFDTKKANFENGGLNWAVEIPTVEQIIVTNELNNERKKKKRFKPARTNQSFEMGGTIENMTQYSNV